ncbi:MAG: hypothetical protein IPJ85_16435 [Flavobacteriales bacterium]|nr:hypothetical protein [Flavobacteriales bacterium]
MQRVFSINQKFYTLLLEKEVEYRISKAGFVPQNRILQNATLAGSPVSPNKEMVIGSYLMVGVIVCLLILLVRYILHDNIHHAQRHSQAQPRQHRHSGAWCRSTSTRSPFLSSRSTRTPRA